MSKIDDKKIPKWCQNGCQSQWIFILFRKGRKRSRPFVSPYIFMFWACKIDAKSMKNQCKIDAGKRYAKRIANDAKREPKWMPKSITNSKISGKRRIEFRMYFRMHFLMDSVTKMAPRWLPEPTQKIQKNEKCGFRDRVGNPYSIFFAFGSFWIVIWDAWGVFRLSFGIDFGPLGYVLVAVSLSPNVFLLSFGIDFGPLDYLWVAVSLSPLSLGSGQPVSKNVAKFSNRPFLGNPICGIDLVRCTSQKTFPKTIVAKFEIWIWTSQNLRFGDGRPKKPFPKTIVAKFAIWRWNWCSWRLSESNCVKMFSGDEVWNDI